MRLSLHTIICCCVFTTVLPLLKGAGGETSSSLKTRSRAWLQSHMKRDLSTTDGQRLDIFSGPLKGGRAKTLSPPTSSGQNKRPKRSTSTKTSGCRLVTCLYHDLIHDLHEIINIEEKPNAPEIKIGKNGYGRRRRRSLPDPTPLLLHTGTHSIQSKLGGWDGRQFLRIFSEIERVEELILKQGGPHETSISGPTKCRIFTKVN